MVGRDQGFRYEMVYARNLDNFRQRVKNARQSLYEYAQDIDIPDNILEELEIKKGDDVNPSYSDEMLDKIINTGDQNLIDWHYLLYLYDILETFTVVVARSLNQNTLYEIKRLNLADSKPPLYCDYMMVTYLRWKTINGKLVDYFLPPTSEYHNRMISHVSKDTIIFIAKKCKEFINMNSLIKDLDIDDTTLISLARHKCIK
jgi:hypothetical protein